jgi:hypothetical protein
VYCISVCRTPLALRTLSSWQTRLFRLLTQCARLPEYEASLPLPWTLGWQPVLHVYLYLSLYILVRVRFKLIYFVFHVFPSSFLECLLLKN